MKILCHCHWQEDRRNALTVIVVHGLEGSSDSGYVIGTAQKGLAAGMNVIRVNQRNCGGTEHLAPTLYNSSLSGDVAAVARNMVDDGISRFALAGFSMGGNLVLKTAGEWGREAPPEFRAVAAVCPAMDLAASADAFHLPGNRIYEAYFMHKLRRRFRDKAKLFPGQFDVARLRGLRSLREFDDKITAYYCGFEGAIDYYARAAASNVVDHISVPGLIIHAANDRSCVFFPRRARKLPPTAILLSSKQPMAAIARSLRTRTGMTDAGRNSKWLNFLGSYRTVFVALTRLRVHSKWSAFYDDVFFFRRLRLSATEHVIHESSITQGADPV